MKTVALYRPTSIGKAMSDFNRYLENFFDSPLGPFTGDSLTNTLPLVDVQEKEDAYLIEADLPGFDGKGVQVHVDNGALTIESVNEEEKKEEQEANYLRRERSRISFKRSFKLPDNADTGQVNAVFKNGVLSLEIRKCEEAAKKRIIQINAE
ncbi:MAG: Hsp20/alpha crystallin family protein [Treponema sp.]|jgi:HSP20 family molecular chaperone IbpA|nr:Hsp20/alpha crystallin family protein [Treponema sp.]